MSNVIQMPVANPVNQRVGMNVRIAMMMRNVTQAQLGSALGLTQSSTSRKLNGQTQWTPDELEAAAVLLRVTIDRLFVELPGLDSNQEPAGFKPQPVISLAERREARAAG